MNLNKERLKCSEIFLEKETRVFTSYFAKKTKVSCGLLLWKCSEALPFLLHSGTLEPSAPAGLCAMKLHLGEAELLQRESWMLKISGFVPKFHQGTRGNVRTINWLLSPLYHGSSIAFPSPQFPSVSL